MTPLGLLRAGNGIEVLLFEKIIKSGKYHPPRTPEHSTGGCEAVAMLWEHVCKPSTHAAGKEAQGSLHRAAEIVKCPQGMLNPWGLSHLLVGIRHPAQHLLFVLLQQPLRLLHKCQL